MSAGMGKSAASFLSAVSCTEAFTIEGCRFVHSLQRYDALPLMETHHIHHCGYQGTQRLMDVNAGQLFHCSCLGGNTHSHGAAKSTLAHAIQNCSLCAVVPTTEVETLVPGGTWKAGILFRDECSGAEFSIHVSIVNVGSMTSQRRRQSGRVKPHFGTVKGRKGIYRLPGRSKTTVVTRFLCLS